LAEVLQNLFLFNLSLEARAEILKKIVSLERFENTIRTF
jgi:hypothetical protein